MELFSWRKRPEQLRAPALVMAFRGWNDAGEAATTAAAFLLGCGESERLAVVDSEELFDYQQTRPRVRIEEGGTRKIEWPKLDLYAVQVPRAPRDLVVLLGPEPSLRWQTLAKQAVEAAELLGIQLVLSLGALLAEIPHSRPVPISALSSDPGLVERLGLRGSNYEGPTGIVGVLHSAFLRAGFPTVSLWASVPHYVAATPNPKAALALVRRCEQLLGVAVDGSSLERATQSDPEVRAFVERLEETAPPEGGLDPDEIPSGEVIAREFQRFLRQRGQDKN